MPMDSSSLRALEAAVGPEHVRTDGAALASYAWMGGVGATPGPRFRHWPVAAVLPGSTEEVAAVVRACVAGGLKFRALSTGNGCMYVGNQPDVVAIDLFRMNRILEIDRFNQMAVIEPYATAGRLQAEAMKHGLTCHIVGAGPGHSPLASATSFLGIGITGASTGQNARNILSLEWVTPEGEIVRIGTAGDDWFSEEGPGIGFRGMIRGYMGAHGALGVFTRIGYKLYPWAGGGKLERTGTFPQNGFAMPDNVQFFAPTWSSAEQMRDGVMRLNRTGQLFALLRMPPSSIGLTLNASNNDYLRRRQAGTMPEITLPENRHGCQILTVGHSDAQTRHQKNIVTKIVSETGGRLLAMDPMDAEVLARGLVTSQYVLRVARHGPGASSYGISDSWKLWPSVVASAEELVKSDLGSGVLATEDEDLHWAWPTESRQLWTEHIVASQPGPKGQAVALGAFLRHLDMMEKQRLGIASFVVGPLIEMFGRHSYANDWMRRIKQRIDPHGHADATQYAAARPIPGSRIWPIAQRMIFSRFGKPFLALGLRMMTWSAARRAPSKYEDPTRPSRENA